jgi:Protein of unknown function (DUF3429)
MKKGAITSAKILTLCGTLPFAGSAALIYWPVTGYDGILIAATYSAIILSFLCGIHWACYLFFADKCPRNLLITSNIIVLIAWGSVLLLPYPLALLLHAVCFLYLLTLDLALRDAGIIPQWFYELRRNATSIVVLCIALIVGIS